ncbi:MAG: NADH-quinone oxidoreductase subunit J [Gammaproteobacteria bacterium]|nr:MAG: NADH-quinone oxidoreductase subunit J [Gammaproteobacteria bacterium]
MMSFQHIVFFAFSAILIFAAGMVVTIRNPVKAALYLVLSFFTAAAIWILLQAEFLAITLVLVYVGAVMVLFLFVVMMLDVNLARLREGFGEYLSIGLLVAVLLVLEMILILSSGDFVSAHMTAPAALAADESNTRALGILLYTDYLYTFEIAGLVLLVAIVAAIALAMRKRKDTKFQDPSKQVRVNRDDRVRIVKMKSGK